MKPIEGIYSRWKLNTVGKVVFPTLPVLAIEKGLNIKGPRQEGRIR
jgi:hypothetical protein